ncbi:MAG: SiaB family protein kinase [Chromatiales bacterium]|nr:SiaB family protein kinase [Chromatiales bacterium]
MSEQKYYEFLDYAQQRDILFYYVGYFSQAIISSMAETVRLHLETNGVPSSTRRRLFSSFVEMAQNIVHYSAASLPAPEADGEIRYGSVCIGQEGERYFLLCANPVNPADVEILRARLDALARMSMEDIRQAYKTSLRAGTPAGSKGANMGFLTVARDASAPLESSFRSGNSTERTMFYLKAMI